MLRDLQQEALDGRQEPDLSALDKFGRQDADVARIIIGKYLEICRTMKDKGLRFGPGVQYNYQGHSGDGVTVTYGDYGLFHATLLAASRDSVYKAFLADQGRALHENTAAFFVNPPATNTVVHCAGNRVLFIKRGPTAEYPNMLQKNLRALEMKYEFLAAPLNP